MDQFQECNELASLVQAFEKASLPGSGIREHFCPTNNESRINYTKIHLHCDFTHLFIFLHCPDERQAVDNSGDHCHHGHRE